MCVREEIDWTYSHNGYHYGPDEEQGGEAAGEPLLPSPKTIEGMRCTAQHCTVLRWTSEKIPRHGQIDQY